MLFGGSADKVQELLAEEERCHRPHEVLLAQIHRAPRLRGELQLSRCGRWLALLVGAASNEALEQEAAESGFLKRVINVQHTPTTEHCSRALARLEAGESEDSGGSSGRAEGGSAAGVVGWWI